MTEKDYEEIRKKVKKMKKQELEELAEKMLITRFKSNLRKKKIKEKQKGGDNER